MEATYCSTITNTKCGNQGALSIEVPDKAFEVYERIYRLKPLYPTETMAYWTCLSARGLTRLFSYLSCCPSSALKGLLSECEELITFCTSMDQIIRNKLVDLHCLHLPFQLSRMQKCLELLSEGNPQFKNFYLKLVSVEVWRDIQEIIKSIDFPFRRERDKSLPFKETHYDFSKCSSPKSILDANSQFSESTFSSEDLDASEGSSLSEEDLSHFKELLSFALESPPSTKKSVSKSKALYNYGSGNHDHDDNTCGMFSTSAACSPLMKSQPSGNVYNCFNPFTDKAIAIPPYPARDSLKKDSVNCPPTKIPAFQASHKCSEQPPQYACPCLVVAAMENQLGYTKNSNFPILPKPKVNMELPNFPIFPQPSSAAAPLNSYNRNNMVGPFNNAGILPIWYSAPYRPPLPVNHFSAPLPFKVPFNQCINGRTHKSQQLHHNFRDSKTNSGYSIEAFESELQELLKGRRKPIRISVLPAMYEERFHKPINSSNEKLTALLSRCRNIVLVYRQGGQHVVMLKHDESLPAVRVSRRTNRSLDPRSRKVYLTFPPGSTFTSDDAEAYFRQFGPVRGVRMSHEEPPTYAFVEFYTCEGALSALCNTRAHYISGQKVMVKPYRQSSAYKF